MKEYALPLASSIATWLLSHFYYRKQRKSDLESRLIARINDLSEKYVILNKKYTDVVDSLNQVQRENKKLKNQITCLTKGKKRNGANNTAKA